MTTTSNESSFRPLIFSTVVAGRAVHALRCGTFTDMYGREFTFTPMHIQALATNFASQQPKRMPPITERHDWGRAFGRITNVYSDIDNQNLYFTPVWNAEGQKLLDDRVYDGISCEIDNINDAQQIALIGASLTNYPAISGLTPVTLSAPQPSQESIMADEPITTPDTAAVQQMITTALQSANIGAQMTDQFTALFTTQLKAYADAAKEQATFEAQRQIAEFQAQQQIASFAQHVTSPSVTRPHALPIAADKLQALLSKTNTDARQEWREVLETILTNGLVSFEELGATGDESNKPSAIERYNAAVLAKVASGLSRAAALSAVNKEQPALVLEYNEARQGGN